MEYAWIYFRTDKLTGRQKKQPSEYVREWNSKFQAAFVFRY